MTFNKLCAFTHSSTEQKAQLQQFTQGITMSYMALKHMHMGLALVSGLLFFIRFFLFKFKPAFQQVRVLKILPHIIDTGLLICAIALCIQISQYPGSHAWLTAKVIGLFAYIGFGILAMRRHSLPAFLLALLSYIYIFGAALHHAPASWLSPIFNS